MKGSILLNTQSVPPRASLERGQLERGQAVADREPATGFRDTFERLDRGRGDRSVQHNDRRDADTALERQRQGRDRAESDRQGRLDAEQRRARSEPSDRERRADGADRSGEERKAQSSALEQQRAAKDSAAKDSARAERSEDSAKTDAADKSEAGEKTAEPTDENTLRAESSAESSESGRVIESDIDTNESDMDTTESGQSPEAGEKLLALLDSLNLSSQAGEPVFDDNLSEAELSRALEDSLDGLAELLQRLGMSEGEINQLLERVEQSGLASVDWAELPIDTAWQDLLQHFLKAPGEASQSLSMSGGERLRSDLEALTRLGNALQGMEAKLQNAGKPEGTVLQMAVTAANSSEAGQQSGQQNPAEAAAMRVAQAAGGESAQRPTEPASPAARGFVPQTAVAPQVGTANWGQAVGERIVWLANQQVSVAQLRLDPPDLGPINVRISAQQDQMTVSFTSAQPAVRDALDQNAPRLRELFAEQGLDLVDVDISDHSQTGADSQSERDGSGSGGGASRGGHSESDVEPAQTLATAIGLIDHYA